MAIRFNRLTDLYWVTVERHHRRLIAGGTFFGGVVGGVSATGTYYADPRLVDTVVYAGAGAVCGALVGIVGPVLLPVIIPTAALVGPIHMYNKYRWENRHSVKTQNK